ncbi:MAG: hypothetical protein ACE141_19055 [Bryobacteraceae bacterium]
MRRRWRSRAPAPGAVYLLNITAGIITLLGVYATGCAVGGGPRAGLWAAALWTVVSGDPRLQANQPDTEVFMNACLAWSFASFLRPWERRRQMGRAVWIEVLIALSSLYEQASVAGPALLTVVWVAMPGKGRPRKLKHAAAMAGARFPAPPSTSYHWLH